MNFLSKNWWKYALLRATKTFFQTMVALIPAATMITQVDWLTALGTSALAFVLSLFTSLGGLPEVEGSYGGD